MNAAHEHQIANRQARFHLALDAQGWFAYIGWSRTDLDYVVYKKADLFTGGEKAYLVIYKQTGEYAVYAGQKWTSIDAMYDHMVDSGSQSELATMLKTTV